MIELYMTAYILSFGYFLSRLRTKIVDLFFLQLCYVSQDYDADLERCQEDPENFRSSISLNAYDLPTGSWRSVLQNGRNTNSDGGNKIRIVMF